MSATPPLRVTALRGHVTAGPYAQGSKSARHAVYLDTDADRYILRRKTGPVFGDAELQQYVGCEVECDGFVVETTLLAERIEVVG